MTLSGSTAIRLVGMNAALRAADDDDHGKLRVGKMQIGQLFSHPMAARDELVVAMSHHPLDAGWLADEKDTSAWVRSSAHIHLSGHVHEADAERVSNAGGQWLVRVVAGSVHGEDLPAAVPASHGYNFAEIIDDNGRLTLRLWPRRWSDKNKKFRLDAENAPNNEHSVDIHLAIHPPEVTNVERNASPARSGSLPGRPKVVAASRATASLKAPRVFEKYLAEQTDWEAAETSTFDDGTVRPRVNADGTWKGGLDGLRPVVVRLMRSESPVPAVRILHENLVNLCREYIALEGATTQSPEQGARYDSLHTGLPHRLASAGQVAAAIRLAFMPSSPNVRFSVPTSVGLDIERATSFVDAMLRQAGLAPSPGASRVIYHPKFVQSL